ncbi:MAG: hypothetical protein ACLFUJ_07130, partial [Phycisphaerae bacterium]
MSFQGRISETGKQTVQCVLNVSSQPNAPSDPRPLRMGVPFGPEQVREENRLRLCQEGKSLVLQQRVLDRWPDGSARWVLLDWISPPGQVEVSLSSPTERTVPEHVLQVKERADGVVVDTGCAEFCVSTGTNIPFASVQQQETTLLASGGSAIRTTDQQGRVHQAVADSVRVLEQGPVRAAVLLEGALAPALDNRLLFACELHFFAGRPEVEIRLSVHNSNPASHPGGMWDLGQEGSVFLQEVAVVFDLQCGNQAVVQLSPEPDASLVEGQTVELYQDSSGGENWDSTCHVNRDNTVPLQFRGYRLHVDQDESKGLRATPTMVVRQPGRCLAVTMEHFWQNFPKALSWDGQNLSVGLWPGQFADLHELQGGERKTHVFMVSLGDELELEDLNWARSPARAAIDPDWVAATGVIPYLLPEKQDPHEQYKQLVWAALDGEDTFLAKRERVDEYGWRHFGDMYADHEAVYYDGPDELVSHYNNQYDGIWGLGVQFLRSGDIRWFEQMQELAMHVSDIDIYHTDGD